MKLGTLDIKKAYFGTVELTSNNAFIGQMSIIEYIEIPDDEIWYISDDENIVTPYQESSLPTIVSNTYKGGKGIIKFEDDVINIGDYAFAGKTHFTFITIPDSVTSLGSNAFNGCRGLTSITIPNGVTSIGKYAFAYCGGLSSIYYDGTISQWDAITKGSDWNYKIIATVVHCSDGDAQIQ